jgi:hypothetical protein
MISLKYLHLFSTTLLALGSITTLVHAESPAAAAPNFVTIPEARIVKVTDRGLSAREIHMPVRDMFVFFYNDTNDSLLSLEIDFGKHNVHCTSSNMLLERPGVVRTAKPVGPTDFATTCFHAAGSYPFTIAGLQGTATPVRGTIIVE